MPSAHPVPELNHFTQQNMHTTHNHDNSDVHQPIQHSTDKSTSTPINQPVPENTSRQNSSTILMATSNMTDTVLHIDIPSPDNSRISKSDHIHDISHNNLLSDDNMIASEGSILDQSSSGDLHGDEWDNDGIPFTHTGHLALPDDEQLYYEYYRNPDQNHPLPQLLSSFEPCLRVPLERRKALVLHQNALLGHKSSILSHTTSDMESLDALHLSGISNSDEDDYDEMSVGSNSSNNSSQSTTPDNNMSPSSSSQDIINTLSPQHQYKHTLSSPSSISDNDTPRHHIPPFSDKGILSWANRSELFSVMELAIPLVLSFLASYGIGLINLAFQGRISEEALAAAATAAFFQNITGLAPLYGLNCGIDTLASHAYGARQYKRVGLITQRGLVLISFIMIGVGLSWWYCAPLLELLGIPTDVALLAQYYTRVCIFAIPSLGYLDAFRRFLEVQQSVMPSLCITGLGLALVPPINWFFMTYLNYGFIGAAYTYIIVNWVMFGAIILYIWLSGAGAKSWPMPSMEIFNDWKPYLKYSIPAVAALAGEWIGFELQTLIAARLGTVPLAAQSLITSINAFLFNVAMGTGMASSARIGAFLGANKPQPAKHSYHIAFSMTLTFQIMLSISIAIFSKDIIMLFTDKENVIEVASNTMPILAISTLFDGIQGMLGGVYRGIGLQNIAFWVSILGFWVLAIPVSILLTHYIGHHSYSVYIDEYGQQISHNGLGLVGIWLALASGAILVTSILLIILHRLDWKAKALEVHHDALAATAQGDASTSSSSSSRTTQDDDTSNYDDDNNNTTHGAGVMDIVLDDLTVR